MILGFAHAALYTDKFEETIRFYKEAFDADELGRFYTERNGCQLRLGESVLEIFESEKLPAEGCFKHIALMCDSVDETYANAVAAGSEEYIAPKNICLELNKPRKLRIAFLKGINNEQIELCENVDSILI